MNNKQIPCKDCICLSICRSNAIHSKSGSRSVVEFIFTKLYTCKLCLDYLDIINDVLKYNDYERLKDTIYIYLVGEKND